MSTNVLELFDQLTARWFTQALGSPTPVQEVAWPAIAVGKHTLVSAPTGTGKTLSAFLVFIDQLKAQARAGTLKQELQLIYVSPLKSLAGDIRENLRKPLNGIFEEERKDSVNTKSTPFDLNIAIRTGDTPQKDRRRMIKTPPHILITTPESLYLMLTSLSGQKILNTAKAIIIDELHAIIDSKRGAHLMLSIARLDKLCPQPLQRIGLSATIEPLEKAAEYLSPEKVTIVAPKMHKKVELAVTSIWPDHSVVHRDSVWHELSRTVYDHCMGANSVIAFVDGRAYAEKLAYFVNQLGGDGFARTHHGSLSKEQRYEVEEALRNGQLRLLCATSSMELGIDVGDIDQVFQIGCPRSISSTLQRLGRAGHNPGRVSVMHIFPRSASEGLYSGLTAEVVRNGGIEYCRPPKLCLDVLAQHLVSMATGDGYSLEEVMELLPRAYPFKDLTLEDVRDVLSMLAGDYEHAQDVPVRPRILYDRIHDRVEGDPYSRMLAISAAGTIPDMGLYTVKTENGVKLGELDEEYVFEAKIGDKFMLGSFAWKICSIQKDSVIVTQANNIGARPPFWKGEKKGRALQTGIAFGKILRRLGNAHETDSLLQVLCELGLDEISAVNAQGFLQRQLDVTGVLPDDRTIIVEHYRDETGNHQMMVHSVFGRQVNEPLAILTHVEAKRRLNTNVSFFDDDDGFLLFPYGESPLPEGLLQTIAPEKAKPVLEALLPATPTFNMTFRYNTARALMMGVRKAGRQPLWVQRLRSAQMLDTLVTYKNHPLIRETRRECLEDYWDLAGVEYVLNGIRSGAITVCEMHLEKPSPMSLPLRQQTEATMMYDYTPTPSSIHYAAEEALKQTQMIAPSPEQLALVSERTHLPEDEKQLHSLLMIEGDLIAGELEVPIDWLENLAHKEQVKYIEPGLWIAAEHEKEYEAAFVQEDLEARKHIVRRMLRYRGAQTPEQVGERYLWTDGRVKEILTALNQQESIVEYDGLYYHAKLYNRARLETIKNRRSQIKTLPSERYAALMTSRVRIIAPVNEQLEKSMKLLCDQAFSPDMWENILLPARVKGYRSELIDTFLSQGNLFWKITPDSGISFHRYDDIDWDSDLSEVADTLEENEKIIYEALLKRGASFMQRLSGLLEGVSPYDTLLNLAEKGLVYADSFVPVRQWMNRDKLNKGTAKQRVMARTKVLTSGRWEIARPLLKPTAEEQLERLFDRVVILCRETIQGLSWGRALEILRIWEYTGRVRRGYFIEGLSGVQFIRDKDFAGTMAFLENPPKDIIWLNAVDPVQPWGKSLLHMQDRSFISVAGTAVALCSGAPVAVLERQGKVLRLFDTSSLSEVMRNFADDYNRRRIFPTQNRITIKEYPIEAAEALAGAGFKREMQDYVLYRGII
ncbi:DEAD/DEAH box helicase [Mobilitalea sibirica]|uniref:DEAD/DEAH box helicase n=1 Tax=Mobilitalea sibirica TaxID=1462919 RepID=A0A8J7GZ00_9FIRM|nr:DEAD/DEAH box helicase [Mobilitalea sibirica]MBH1940944.1 DEAD/DEAH box helicase [Mobilitalea sibirica]